MPNPERQPVGKEIPDGEGGAMSTSELAAALDALGHPVALKIINLLLKPEPPPPQIKEGKSG